MHKCMCVSGGRGRGRERESQAESLLSMGPDIGLDLMTLSQNQELHAQLTEPARYSCIFIKNILFIYLRDRESQRETMGRGRGRSRFPAEWGANAGLDPRTLR